jgi:hypothetical protein
MFQQAPEHPPHMASKWIALIAVLGGIAGVAVTAYFLGEEAFQSNVVMFGSFGAGALLGLVAGWKIVMPRRRSS